MFSQCCPNLRNLRCKNQIVLARFHCWCDGIYRQLRGGPFVFAKSQGQGVLWRCFTNYPGDLRYVAFIRAQSGTRVSGWPGCGAYGKLSAPKEVTAMSTSLFSKSLVAGAAVAAL